MVGGGHIRVLGADGIFTRSMVNPQRPSCAAALTPEYSSTLDYRRQEQWRVISGKWQEENLSLIRCLTLVTCHCGC
jgi:hypothetical protein